MSVPVTAEWCGACGTETSALRCPTCSFPLRTADADDLRSISVSYRLAVQHGDVDTAEVLRAHHARLIARYRPDTATAPPAASPPDGGAEPPTAAPGADASTIVTWVGAALLLAGALAFATVVWQYAGGTGRIALLGVVTVAALVAADRLRMLAPTTAEAAVVITAGMVLVDATAARVAGYTPGWPLAPYVAMSTLPAGLAFLLLARAWGSRAAGACGVVLVGLGTAALASWPLLADTATEVVVLTIVGAGLASAALGVASRSVRRPTERLAIIVAAVVLWGVQLAVSIVDVGLDVVGFGSSRTGGALVAEAAALSAFALLPLVARVRSAGFGVVAGLAAAFPAITSVVLTAAAISASPIDPTTAQLWAVACLSILVLVPTAVARMSLRAGAGTGEPARAITMAMPMVAAYLLGGLVEVMVTQRESGDVRAALVVALLGLVAVAPTVLLDKRVESWITDLAAMSAIAGPLAAVVLLAPTLRDVHGGDALAVSAALVMLASWFVPVGTWRTGARYAALLGVVVAPVLGLTAIEVWSVPAAVVAAGFGLQAYRAGIESSWTVEAPAAVLLLAPSLVAGVDGAHTGLRLTAVAVLGAAVLVDAARRRRQGPAVVAVVAITFVTAWVGLPHLSEMPSWLALVAAGSVLLWIGFTWERRRDTARQLSQSWSSWE